MVTFQSLKTELPAIHQTSFPATFPIAGAKSPVRLSALKRDRPSSGKKPSRTLPELARPSVAARLGPDGAAIPQVKKWLFRFGALFLIPVLLLGGGELILRLAGYGYPTDFFLPQRIGERETFVENGRFAWRFFPARLARRPSPTVMEAHKHNGVFRVFVFGESAAMGDPNPSFSVSRILEVLLRERFQGAQFEIVNVAFTAINSHVILPIAQECARHQGDLWIIYMGNNEVVGPFGPATIAGEPSLNLNLIRASVALKRFKVGQLLEQAKTGLMPGAAGPISWAGLRMFVENQIRQEDSRLSRVYDNFEANLQSMLRAGESTGARILVSTVASNLKDCPPFSSAHAPELSESRKASWDQAFQEGLKLESSGQFEEAIRSYTRAGEIDAGFAELQFRLGRCHLAQNRIELARPCFEQARDLDTLRFRADSRLNAIVTHAAVGQEGRGIHLVDAREALGRACLDGLPGDELFFDHVHLSFEGNYALAAAFAEQAAKALPGAISVKDTGHWASAELCAQRLALTGWDRYQMYELMERRLQEPPFAQQSNQAARLQRFREKLAGLKWALAPGGLEQAAALYRSALEIAPNYFQLHENFARLLDARGDVEGVIAHTRKFAELAPHCPTPYYNLGLISDAQGRATEALDYFAQALRHRPDYPEAFNGIGQTQAKRGLTNEALAAFQRALQLRPDYVEALLNVGEMREKAHDFASARESYLKAFQIQSNSFAIRLHVGDILVRTGDLFEATKHHAEAVRLQPAKALSHFAGLIETQPADPMSHFLYANALAADGRAPAALPQLQEAVRLKPEFWEARYLLGVELALQNKLSEAEGQFREVIRFNANFAPARVNLGVALAKAMKLSDARQQFEAALQFDPTNKLARQYLQTLQSMGR